jgi:hypothetical protein
MVLGYDAAFEAIAAAGNCFDEAWTIISKLSPQLADALDKNIVGHGQTRPDCFEQGLFRNEAAAVLDKVTQDGEGFGSKDDFAVVEKQTAAIQV